MTTFVPSPMTALIDRTVRYDLAESTCPPLRVGDLGRLDDVPLGYGTTQGDAGLRALIAADAGVGADQVLVTIGAIEAMFLLAQVTCDPGDRVVLVGPCFPPARALPTAIGARVDVVSGTFDDGYRLPLDRIAAALTADTRLVSLASPQNPSGVRVTDEELAALLAAVAERAPGAVTLVDETYLASTYGDAPVPRSAAGASPRVVTCSSLSKAHGAPGLRIGWLTCTDPELYARLREAKFLTTIACPTIDEALAVRVLQGQAEILGTRARGLRRSLDTLLRWARDRPVEIVVPDGGPLCCLRLPADADADAFYDALAARDVRVAPGSWFGEDDRVFRLGFGHLPAADFDEALNRLGDAL